MAASSAASAPALEWAGSLAEFVRGQYGPGWALELELPSERDKNFKIRNGEVTAVCKVHNQDEALEFVECQDLAARQVAARWPSEPLLCQVPLPSVRGPAVLRYRCEEAEATFAVRLLPYLPGEVLAKVEHTPEVLEATGVAVGRVTSALLDFEHPAARRDFCWDLARCDAVFREHLPKVKAERRRALVESFRAECRRQCGDQLSSLRRSAVHNDPNDYNLLARQDASGVEVSILDFGDMVYSYTVADAAIGLAYLLFSKADPVRDSLPFVVGFHRSCPLSSGEVTCLLPLALLRVCTSVCMSAYQQVLRPDDAYLTISEAPAWTFLETFCLGQFAAAREAYRIELKV